MRGSENLRKMIKVWNGQDFVTKCDAPRGKSTGI